MYGGLIKLGEKSGEISIQLNSGRKKFTITTKVKQPKRGSDFEEIGKETQPRTFPWQKLFVAGYGPHRAMRGTNSYEEYAIADAVYTLFNYEWELQNPELVVRRRGWDDRSAVRKLQQQLARILMIDEDDVSLTNTGWTIKSRQGNDIGFGALADGHRSTMSWVLDLISWTSLASPELHDPAGIVLIDEIEQHLHPSWQRHIMRLLGEQFPNIQFIATSHSALCAAGVYEKKDATHQMGEAHVLRTNRDGAIVSHVLPEMEGLRYDRVLSSYAFEIPPWPLSLEVALEEVRKQYRGPKSTSSPSFKRAIEKLRKLSRSEAAFAENEFKKETYESELGMSDLKLENELQRLTKKRNSGKK